MKRRRSAPDRSNLTDQPSSAPVRVQPWGIACIFGILLGLALWRLLLSAGVGGGPSATVIAWRQLDSLIAWIALALVLLIEPGGIATPSLRVRRSGAILAVVLAVSAILAGASQAMLQSEMSGAGSNAPEIVGFLGDGLLALAGIAIAFRELKRILGRLGGGPSKAPEERGLTLLDLWRFASVQWALLMVAAILYLRVQVSPEDAAGNEQIRRLLFFLPAAGVLPNAMMAGGIAAWNWILARQNLQSPVRLRAWLVALGAMNVGAILLVIRPAFLGIPGGLFALAAVVLYVLGFPPTAWRTLAGRIVLLAWILLAGAVAAATLERLLELGNGMVSTFYGSTWRHLWGVGAIGLWLLGTGFWLVEREPAGRGVRRAVQLAAIVFAAGVLLAVAVFLIAITQSDAGQRAVLHWLLAGTVPAFLGLLIAGAAMVRVFRSYKALVAPQHD